MRANDYSGQNVAEHNGLFELMAKDCHQSGDNHHYRKILKKCNCVHFMFCGFPGQRLSDSKIAAGKTDPRC
jgi:hypothetical protein